MTGRSKRKHPAAEEAGDQVTMHPVGRRQRIGPSTFTGKEKRAECEAPAALERSAIRKKILGAAGQAWTAALQELMGVSTTGTNTVEFIWGSTKDQKVAPKLEDFAQWAQRDVIRLGFAEPFADGPSEITVAILGKRGVTVFEGCELWVLNHWSRVEIVAANRRFKFDDYGRLTGKPNSLDEMRARRVALTHKRWRALAAEKAECDFPECRWVPTDMSQPYATWRAAPPEHESETV